MELILKIADVMHESILDIELIKSMLNLYSFFISAFTEVYSPLEPKVFVLPIANYSIYTIYSQRIFTLAIFCPYMVKNIFMIGKEDFIILTFFLYTSP